MKSLIIDAGHGGSDSGAVGGGYLEKNWTLEISLYQYKRLKELGAKVGITRTSDRTLNSQERTALVRNKYDYCMSNHWNGHTDKTANGVETIHSIYSDGKIAKDLCDVIVKASGLKYRRVFTRTLPNNSKRDYYYMHRETGKTETIIVEYGFITNYGDREKYKNDKVFYDVAEKVVEYWCKVLGVKYVPPKTTDDELYKVQVGAFAYRQNAEKLLKELKSKGYTDAFIVKGRR